ncbi:MAG TPA: AbrB/MazE/SpoVT family DNA-binding domain-containing protein [Terracidiphilus sp.]|nr:AbrB/MazE/SpoVT family DNA-binding domain-containing protein [Terracidiphilus sp.]
MPSAMVTFNGRITLPTDIRKQLGLKTGDNIDFVEIEKGQFAIRPRTSTVSAVEARVPSPPHASIAKEVSETVQ